MTYLELARKIASIPGEYLNHEVTILEHQEELFGVVGMCNAEQVCLDNVVEKHHPILILNGVFTEEELKDINFV